MAKIRMNNAHRDVLRDFAYKKLDQVIDRKEEKKLYRKLLIGANKLIRKRYTEKEMEVLDKYNLTTIDNCLKFQFPSGRVDGFEFTVYHEKHKDYDPTLVVNKVPYSRSCSYSPLREIVFVTDEEYENTMDVYNAVKKANDEIYHQKKRDCDTLIGFAKYVEDVLEVIQVPLDVKARLTANSTALVALTPDVINRIQQDFNA